MLALAKVKIEDPKNWCQGELARNAEGKASIKLDDELTLCARGCLPTVGFNRSIRFLTQAAYKILEKEGMDTFRNGISQCPVVVVNDELGHAKVMEMFDIAIQLENEHAVYP